MVSGTLISIILVETLIVVAVLGFILWRQNCKFKLRIAKLQSQTKKKPNSVPPPPPVAAESPEPQLSTPDFKSQLLTHVQETKSYHSTLDDSGDIALDIDPQTPEHRRVAALRYAVLVAESEAAVSDSKTNWEILNARYGQILRFLVDYSPSAIDAKVLINAGKIAENTTKSEQDLDELKGLRDQIEDQTKLIEELLGNFNPQPDAETQTRMIDELNMEVTKQQRLLEDSDKCIQSLQRELQSTKTLLAEFTRHASKANALNIEKEELLKKTGGYEQIASDLTRENKELKKQLN